MAEEIIEAYKEYEKEEKKLDQTIIEKVSDALGIPKDQVDVTISEEYVAI